MHECMTVVHCTTFLLLVSPDVLGNLWQVSRVSFKFAVPDFEILNQKLHVPEEPNSSDISAAYQPTAFPAAFLYGANE